MDLEIEYHLATGGGRLAEQSVVTVALFARRFAMSMFGEHRKEAREWMEKFLSGELEADMDAKAQERDAYGQLTDERSLAEQMASDAGLLAQMDDLFK